MDESSRAQSSAKAAPQARPAAARPAPKAAAPDVTVAPHVEPAARVGPPPEGLRISPTLATADDPSIGLDWEVVLVGTNQSSTCTITSAPGHDLIVTLAQSTYQRSWTGTGVVRTPAIPPAPVGTQGQLTVRDAVTGATVAYAWQWQVREAAHVAAAPARLGFLGRLLQGRSRNAPTTSRGQTQTESAAARATRLGPRAASAMALRFFAQEAVGQRFAFILDMSGSMRGTRWAACSRELAQALRAMPEDVEFFVVLFSTGLREPPEQGGWMKAERNNVERTVEWVDGIGPGGGTDPRPAFERVFGLPDVPDVVYFLTDGEVEGFTPDACAALRGSHPTIINTISLESQASVATLEAIATDSGGRYSHVPAAAG
jgi:Mg-chelatase subunit ChlD